MYGLINKAIHDMVCERFGEETWQEVSRLAEVEGESFISLEAYPDDVTHRLVKAASQVLRLSAAEIMHAFGEYWVVFTAKKGYGDLMEMTGESLPDFLHNLDELHTRLSVSFPNFKPPTFDCDEADEETLELHYHSHREGWAPMVTGIVKGLGDRFETDVEVTQTHSKAEGADHDEFSIRYQSK